MIQIRYKCREMQRKEQEMRQRNEIYGTIRKGDLIPKSD